MRNLSRRDYCRVGLASTVGSIAGCNLPEPEPNAIQIDISQSKAMVNAATEAGLDKSHALDMLEQAFKVSIGDLAERADGFGKVEITRTEEPVDTSEAFSGGQLLQIHEQTHATGGTVDKNIHSALLVDAIGDVPFTASGMAEDHGGSSFCPLKEDATDGSTYSVMLNGANLLQATPDDIQLNPGAENVAAHGAAALAVHEVGHNLCLQHSHGRITREKDGVVVSPMAVGYALELAGEETACGKKNADITTEEPSNREVEGINNETVTFRNFNEEATPAEPVRLTLRFSNCAANQI